MGGFPNLGNPTYIYIYKSWINYQPSIYRLMIQIINPIFHPYVSYRMIPSILKVAGEFSGSDTSTAVVGHKVATKEWATKVT